MSPTPTVVALATGRSRNTPRIRAGWKAQWYGYVPAPCIAIWLESPGAIAFVSNIPPSETAECVVPPTLSNTRKYVWVGCAIVSASGS